MYNIDNDSLSYNWYFGDGTSAITTEANGTSAITTEATVHHTYKKAGQYIAYMRVVDAEGASDMTNQVTIVVGRSRPEVKILRPFDRSLFQAGQTVYMQGAATSKTTTGRSFRLTKAKFKWTFGFFHGAHVHPLGEELVGAKVSYTLPYKGHTFSKDTGLEIVLTVIDEVGVSNTDTVRIMPEMVKLPFTSKPSGVRLQVDLQTYHSKSLMRILFLLSYANRTVCGGPVRRHEALTNVSYWLPFFDAAPFKLMTVVGFEHSITLPSCMQSVKLKIQNSSGFNSERTTVTVTDQLEPVHFHFAPLDGRPCKQSQLHDFLKDSLVAHFDAASDESLLTVEESASKSVVAWYDKIHGVVLNASGSPQYVDSTISPAGFIRFSSSDDYLESLTHAAALPTGSSERTMFAVVRYVYPRNAIAGPFELCTQTSHTYIGLKYDSLLVDS